MKICVKLVGISYSHNGKFQNTNMSFKKLFGSYKAATTTRLNANAHCLESLSDLDQPWQFHIVFNVCLFCLIFIFHIFDIIVTAYLYQNLISFGFVKFSYKLFLIDCVDICPSVQGYLLDGLSFCFEQRT